MEDHHYLVPQHYEGLRQDLEDSIVAETVEDAEDWFVDAKDKLWDVNKWTQNNPAVNVKFHLTDSHGHAVNRKARKDDHIRTGIYGNEFQEGAFDWAVIDAIEYDDYPDENRETFAIRVRRPNATNMNPESVGTDASVTLVIERSVQRLVATYHGRNEWSSEDTSDKEAGIWPGLTGEQWCSFLKGLLAG